MKDLRPAGEGNGACGLEITLDDENAAKFPIGAQGAAAIYTGGGALPRCAEYPSAPIHDGAYHRGRGKGIEWFRTSRSLEAGLYRRHARRNDPPDVCIAASVPALIMEIYPWLHEEEAAFQEKMSHPDLSVLNLKRGLQ
ncbi:MAG: hypothetical protein WAM73_16350 [Desulfobacterales bacterium]